MSYTPINWQTGETITADKLNKMDNGWGIGYTQLFSETVIAEDHGGFNTAEFTYEDIIDYNTIKVTFNNNEYICDRIFLDDSYYYGGFTKSGPDFSEYPFLIGSGGGHNTIYTSTAGTCSVDVSVIDIVISDNFSKAVESVFRETLLPFLCVSGVTTWQEMADAVASGRLLYFYTRQARCHFITGFTQDSGENSVTAIPAGVPNTETYGFNNNMIFTIYNF